MQEIYAIEGIDLSGKSTLAKIVVTELQNAGINAILYTFANPAVLTSQIEIDNLPFTKTYCENVDKFRKVIFEFKEVQALNSQNEGISSESLQLTYATIATFATKSMYELLENGYTLILDRCWYSTLAYYVKNTRTNLTQLILKDLLVAIWPKIKKSFILNLDRSTLILRQKTRLKAHGLIDQYDTNTDFLEKVNENYLKLAEKLPHCHIINAANQLSTNVEYCLKHILQL